MTIGVMTAALDRRSAPAPDAPTIFDELESEVQCYARSFPVVFDRAEGAYLYGRDGRRYLDFLAGAGSLNYGHNEPRLRRALIDYIVRGGVTLSLDLHTAAKEEFLVALDDCILAPRGLEYVVQFTGPTGTNAVEAAIKLARRVTGRTNVVSFTNGFHGVTLGALAATGNAHHRGAAGLPLAGSTTMPYDGYFGSDVDTVAYLERFLDDASSGVDLPAAVLVETVQGEGGLNVARDEWLRALERACRARGILLIVDDIQAGCGRTGTFFSFEPAGITPDVVTLSKSLSGYGLPLAVVLLRPDLDQWQPGEHNGTFRGNNHAFVTAAAALRHYWRHDHFMRAVRMKSRIVATRLRAIAERHRAAGLEVRGRGLMMGLGCREGALAGAIAAAAFERGLVIETSGAESQVVKCLCPLVIPTDDLHRGLDILEAAVADAVGRAPEAATGDVPEHEAGGAGAAGG
jgi:diaminobutyrate-2-oxoglutarate transaminase